MEAAAICMSWHVLSLPCSVLMLLLYQEERTYPVGSPCCQTMATSPIRLVMMQKVQASVLGCWPCRETELCSSGAVGVRAAGAGMEVPLWDSIGFCNSYAPSLEVFQARLDGTLSNLI